MSAPQSVTLQRFGYTVPTSLTPAVQPGVWLWSGRNKITSVFGSFEAGDGPASADFTASVLIGGASVATITVPQGTDTHETDVSPLVNIANGALVSFQILTNGGATSPVILGFNYY